MIIKNLFQYKPLFYINDNSSNKAFNHDNSDRIVKRNYGIDLLRIISMIKIIIIHTNQFSRQIKLNISSPKFKHIWRSEIFSYSSVNCFGLISGIVGYKKYKFSNLIYLWILVFFYSVSISSYFYFFNKNEINYKYFILSFFPILIKRHWYVNAYFLMYLLLPFINYGIAQLPKNIYRNLVLFLLCFYLSHYTITRLIGIENNTFLMNGFSSMWLLLLYIIGGYIGKYITSYSKNKKYLCLYSLIYIFLSLFSSETYFLLLKSKRKIKNNFFISYVSPTMVFQALSLIMLFSNIKIENEYLMKIISFVTPLNFSAQLIHTRLFNSRIRIIKILFKWLLSFNNKGLIVKIYGFAILIYIICIIIDYLRFVFFKFLKIRKFCLFIERKFPEIMDKIYK